MTLGPLTATRSRVAAPMEAPVADAAAAFLSEGVAHFATPGHERRHRAEAAGRGAGARLGVRAEIGATAVLP